MVLGFGAEFLDSTGNPQDAAAAGVLRYVLETRGADIPMPGADTDPASEKRVADRAGHLAIVVG
ncbi:MAG TPA: hypothetical protein VLF43_02335, partial [Candidatus Saccharimonadales bacterium]|nr:hypothetical protein [Candidatus Saccharimonadales bacterium]